MPTPVTPHPLLRTQRLQLRPLTLNDEQEIFDIRSNPDVIRFTNRKAAEQLSEAIYFINWINSGISQTKWLYWGITLPEDNRVIGTACMWNFSDDGRMAEMGYELLPAHQGQGIMQEALTEVIRYAFEQLQLNAIEACTHKDNVRSLHLLNKLGFVPSDTDSTPPDDDTVVYNLSKA